MTQAKLVLDIAPDGYDTRRGTGLIQIHGRPDNFIDAGGQL